MDNVNRPSFNLGPAIGLYPEMTFIPGDKKVINIGFRFLKRQLFIVDYVLA
mgnify:FL=1